MTSVCIELINILEAKLDQRFIKVENALNEVKYLTEAVEKQRKEIDMLTTHLNSFKEEVKRLSEKQMVSVAPQAEPSAIITNPYGPMFAEAPDSLDKTIDLRNIDLGSGRARYPDPEVGILKELLPATIAEQKVLDGVPLSRSWWGRG